MIKLLLTYIVLLLSAQSMAINTDSLLSASVKITKPYIILNFTSADCVMCRGGAVSIISRLKNKENNDKIVLLSDDRNMAIYYRQNADIYGTYKKIYNKELSEGLAIRQFSTACLVQGGGKKCFLMNKISNDTLAYIQSVLDNSTTVHSLLSNVFTDSMIISDIPVFSYNQDDAILLNRQFQFALVHDIQNATISYAEPEINDTNVGKIYKMIKTKLTDSFTDVAYSRKVLKMGGMPQLIIKNIDNNIGRSILFRLNTVITQPMINDTDYHYSVSGKILLAFNCTNKKNVLNINNYSSYLWLDTLHSGNDILRPETVFNYEIANGHFYLPYYKVDDSMLSRVLPTQEQIVEFTYDSSQKITLHNKYPLPLYSEKPYNYFFRIHTSGYPIVVNEMNKTFIFLSTNETVSFEQLTRNSKENLYKVFDFKEQNDTIKYVGTLQSGICIKGFYALKTRMAASVVLHKTILYTNMKISGNSIYAYHKDIDGNKYSYDEYRME
jgi:hypothetical protein